jgi:hypothetical protein
MLAIIGNGEELQTEPIKASEYNLGTGILTLLKYDYTKVDINTKLQRVALAQNGRVINTFRGEIHETNNK